MLLHLCTKTPSVQGPGHIGHRSRLAWFILSQPSEDKCTGASPWPYWLEMKMQHVNIKGLSLSSGSASEQELNPTKLLPSHCSSSSAELPLVFHVCLWHLPHFCCSFTVLAPPTLTKFYSHFAPGARTYLSQDSLSGNSLLPSFCLPFCSLWWRASPSAHSSHHFRVLFTAVRLWVPHIDFLSRRVGDSGQNTQGPWELKNLFILLLPSHSVLGKLLALGAPYLWPWSLTPQPFKRFLMHKGKTNTALHTKNLIA